jgi:hypothetical protein
MMIALLFIVIGLVAWALHLMQEAIEQKEFSLMLAGSLVASAAAALVGVYFLMGNCMGYITHLSPRDVAWNQEAYESVVRYLDEQDQIYLSESAAISQAISRNDR